MAGTAQTGTSGSPSEPAVPPLVIPVSVPVSAGSQVGPGAPLNPLVALNNTIMGLGGSVPPLRT